MKLLTKELENMLSKHPFGSTENDDDPKVIVKFFNPYGSGTWLITEGERQEDGTWLLYGLFHIFDWEWGYVSMKEIEFTNRKMYPFCIEREKYDSGNKYKISELKERIAG